MGIYKRKQESKKTSKHTFDQENNQEKKKKERKHALDQESDQEKKKNWGGGINKWFLPHILTMIGTLRYTCHKENKAKIKLQMRSTLQV